MLKSKSFKVKLTMPVIVSAKPDNAAACVIAVILQRKGFSSVIVKDGRVKFNDNGFRHNYKLPGIGRKFIEEFDSLSQLSKSHWARSLNEIAENWDGVEFNLDSREAEIPKLVAKSPEKSSKALRPNTHTRKERVKCCTIRRYHPIKDYRAESEI